MKNHIENKITKGEQLNGDISQAPFSSCNQVRKGSGRQDGGQGSGRAALIGLADHAHPARLRRESRFGASYRFRCPKPLGDRCPRISEFAALGFWTEARSDV
jgi:hypothetical protein